MGLAATVAELLGGIFMVLGFYYRTAAFFLFCYNGRGLWTYDSKCRPLVSNALAHLHDFLLPRCDVHGPR